MVRLIISVALKDTPGQVPIFPRNKAPVSSPCCCQRAGARCPCDHARPAARRAPRAAAAQPAVVRGTLTVADVRPHRAALCSDL